MRQKDKGIGKTEKRAGAEKGRETERQEQRKTVRQNDRHRERERDRKTEIKKGSKRQREISETKGEVEKGERERQ